MGQLGGLSPEGSVAVGIIVGLISTSVQSLGLTLQRKSHILEDEKALHLARRPPHRRRRWQLGMGMFVISNLLGSTIQITTLPLPVLSTLQASGLVFNSICATVILGEPFTRWSLGGTILVCTGAVLIAIFGAIPEPAHNLDELLDFLGQRTFLLWMLGQALLVAIIIAITKLTKALPPRGALTQNRIRLLRGIAYGCISGILSAHSLLVAKSAVELLVRTIVDRINQFNRWQSWVTLLGLVAFALSQLYYLHRGLKLCSTSILYPLVFCVYNIIAILDGLIYFRQASRLTPLRAALIALGTLILLIGVLALSWRLNTLNDGLHQHPPVSSTPLTPGGFAPFIDSPNVSTPSTSRSPSPSEHAAHVTKSLSSLPRGSPAVQTHRRLGDRFPTTRHRRLTEAAEIWGELQDDSDSPHHHHSRSPARSRRASMPTSLLLGQARSSGGPNGNEGVASPNESTSLLRSSTSRTYAGANDGWRRRSSHFPPLQTSSRSRSGRRRERARSSVLGWWRQLRGERERGLSANHEDGQDHSNEP